ncbi:uncharacterized protein LOC128858751 [Anastrepha ludens]|uniref:uncharacterized protein LOC128858751 n=1 Tax=Anastrepha ludens TaxID=28586 RepID=UPI0023B1F7FD|nr:uncharacterized protein LOC128858751 [Anastrepha ludens]
MDFDDAKENIQPLAAGRNASILHASLRVESPQELLAQRRELERVIHEYKGDDPLEPWYAYISWIEQSFPSGGKESGLEEVLTKCLSRFENEERYFQDRRMIKLYMKFIDSHQHPMECYQQLFDAGIGTMVADFYICWAYHYDTCGNTRKADEIFRRGIACRAQPLEELQEAHQHFGFSVSQRLLYQDDEDVKENTKRQFEERRLALTSLRGHRRKAIVGSIRTGAAVKSYTPGTVQTTVGASSSRQSNTRVQVLHDENASSNLPLPLAIATAETEREDPKSVVRSIIDAARNQENHKEPGPWNKAHDKKKSGKLFARSTSNTDLGFNIHEDVEMEDVEYEIFNKPMQPPITEGERNYDKPFKYPANFKNKNLPQNEWLTPVTIENASDPRTLPQYNKCCLYPRPNVEFQPEEYRAYCRFRKRNISNEFTAKRERYWSNGINWDVRQYPNFAKQSRPQRLGELDAYLEPEKKKELVVCFSELYDTSAQVEYQWEELMAKRLRRNDTILMTADMDETMCDISERAQRRKSFFPLRKSIAPRQTITKPQTNDEDITDITAYRELKEQRKIINDRDSVDIPNKKEIPKESNDVSVPPIKPVQTFDIFEDSNVITKTSTAAVGQEVVIYQEEFPTAAGLDFKFKTPALPNTTALALGPQTTTTTNKLGFEIYTEASSTDSPPVAVAAEGAVGGVIFDPEETCSTQIFNVFIKSQSVSTPKTAQKVAPRESGSILKCIPNTPEIVNSPDCPPVVEQSGDEQENRLKDVAEYSPLLVKQLSTILETSEHGTTQGTHTTGGTTTKSSNSTSDGEGEREVATRLPMPHTDLEPLEEQSQESSTVPPEIIAPTDNNNLHGNTTTHGADMSQPSTVEVKSLEKMRLQIGPETQAPPAASTGGLNFSIFEDEHTEALKVKQAGNFTRIDEREDTAAGFAIRSIRFQEDKTETVPKMLLNSRSIVTFQEDKTETLPKIVITQASMGFETEKTDTMPKIPLEAPILTLVKDVSSNLDDSFEFFGQTPPGKSILHPRYEVSVFKECMEARTPATKRHCSVDTPDLKHFKPPQSTQMPSIATSGKSVMAGVKGPAVFEDEVEKLNSKKNFESIPKPLNTQKTMGPTVPAVHRTIGRDSFLPDFSFIEESQPKANTLINDDANLKEIPSNVRSTTVDTNSEKLKAMMESQALHESAAKKVAERNEVQERQAKSDLGDSYLKNFSEIMDSQPVQSDNKWHRSATKSQRAEMQKTVNENISNSFLKDFSAVMESQPTKKESACQQNISITNKDLTTNGKLEVELSKLKLSKRKSDELVKFDFGNAYPKDFSIVMESQPAAIEREPHQTKSFADKQVVKQKSEEVEKIEIGDCLLKDLSLVMDSQSVANEKQLRQSKYLSTMTTTTPVTASLFTKPEVNPQIMQENNKPDLGSSYLKDFSFVPETQPNENANYCHQNKMVSNKSSSAARQNPNPSINITDSYINNFSMALETPAIDSTTKCPQKQLEKLTLEPALPAQPLLFLDSYMKDFSGFQGRLDDSTSGRKNNNRLLFLNESKKLSTPLPPMPLVVDANKELKAQRDAPNKLYFLDKSRSSISQPAQSNRLSAEKFFELSAETAMFSTNISMIKNSTLLPHNEQNILSAPTPIKETSVHIKQEVNEPVGDTNNQQQDNAFKTPPLAVNKLPLPAPNAPNVLSQSSLHQEKTKANSTGAIPKTQSVKKTLLRESKIPQPLSNFKAQTNDVPPVEVDVPEVVGDDDDADAEMSIYFKHTPKTPKIEQHIWHEKSPSPRTPSKNVYVHRDVDLNVTNQIVDSLNEDPQVNPFNAYLQGAFLEQIDFSNYIDELPNCMLVGHVSRLSNTSKVKVNDVEFDVLKLVGEGAYGVVYSGVNSKTGKKYALKQERPPNFWEYYICLEVHSRLNSDDLVCAFMSIDYALIGNNSSVLISPFSTYGSLITVCNKVKKHTLRNVDEYVVMLLTCELLSIIDHLHAVNIIHADIKADNFILMKKLDYNSTQYALQLIDFGVSIDMKLFKPGQTFNYVHNENAFKCVEMREGRPWTYQLDLYGLAGVIHVLLFGKFMDITQRANGTWMHKTHVPRYINRTLWDTIFQSLLNVRDCDSMPNLQNLRALIKEEIAEKEKFVVRKVTEFNLTLIA